MTLNFIISLFLFYIIVLDFSEACGIFEINKQYLNKRLIGHRIKEMVINGRHDCIRECFYLSKCKSTDYNGYDHICKLNDVDSKYVELTEFEIKEGSIFSDITDWPKAIGGQCGQKPCSDKQRCLPGISTFKCMDIEPADCKDIKKGDPLAPDGVYNITLWRSKEEKSVYCEMTTDGGGWTVLQYRFNGEVNFTRNYTSYADGFGSFSNEFWLGLKTTREMLSRGATELRIDITAADSTSVYVVHKNFDLGPAYRLHLDQGEGTADDGMKYHNGMLFSTYDVDRDNKTFNCALRDRGGWWYKACANVNLNGEYVEPGTERPDRSEAGMIYKKFRENESLKESRMMFRLI